MRRIMTIILCLSLAAGLCACGSSGVPTDELVPMEPTEVTPESAEDIASETTAAAIAAVVMPASESDAAPNEDYAAALALVGSPVEALYDELGEPTDAQYAASCEEENAEDGMLFYNGFYVWTVRTETEELIHDVYPMD